MNSESLRQIKSAFAFLVIAALLGLILRFAFVFELPECIKYKNIQHAHSHTAMMGWLTACFYIFICKFFNFSRKIYKYIFWISQLIVFSLLISFSVQGYSLISIILSVLFILVNYAFVYQVFKDLKSENHSKKTLSLRFLKASLFFLVFSSIGIWAMGPIIGLSLKGSAWYYGAVQFYLHFQFNGWFIFGLLAIFFKILEDNSIKLEETFSSRFYKILFVSCLLTYALSITWSTPLSLIFWANSLGVILQGIALIYFLIIIKSIATEAKLIFDTWHFNLWGISFFCFSFKILIQTLVAIPLLAKVSYTIHNFVIGFVHLLMLGVLSSFFFGLVKYCNLALGKLGIKLFILGIICTEVLLFLQGLLIWLRLGFMPGYHLILALCSMLLLIGASFLMLSTRSFKPDME